MDTRTPPTTTATTTNPPTTASLSWQHGTVFTAEGGGDTRLTIDITLEKGGSGVGFSPMQLLLHALASCLSVTVVQILQKQRLSLTAYQIEIVGDRADEPRHPYSHIMVEHRFRGEGLTQANLERLVVMVEERYCSVAATLPHGLVSHRAVLLPNDPEARES
jgi:putative redox protein